MENVQVRVTVDAGADQHVPVQVGAQHRWGLGGDREKHPQVFFVKLLLMIGTGFMGYVLPWGQMSYWAATVITNLFSAFPIVGEPIVTWLWGGYAVGNPTLQPAQKMLAVAFQQDLHSASLDRIYKDIG